ncbi:hypothetical protein ACJJIE_04380 [Microbulbifer sp. TRSA001]|uniref:hypothetical protein n=1 Tax=Microbulbifer sp. TRSA001 TaxID=3243381 RepID=UPI0040398EB0
MAPFSGRSNTVLTIKVQELAWEQQGKLDGVLFHPDQGGQYMSRQFWNLKSERIPSPGYSALARASQDTSHYLINCYNIERPYQYNGRVPTGKTEEKT